jgi:hypothetical protein
MPVDPNAVVSFYQVDTFTTASAYPMAAPNTGGVLGAIGRAVGGFLDGIFGGHGSDGGSGHGSDGSGSGHASPSPVGDHYGHTNGIGHDRDNGWNGHPVLLDLSGNGLSIDPLSASQKFIDLDGDGYQHRTAWAGQGTGVLVLDANGDGKISRSSEFVFTEWDQTAAGDLEALKSVFDTNHNGLLDSGDARWSEFKVSVDGQLVGLASLGIASIGPSPTGIGQSFTDGSAITGTTTFTRTDGTTGAGRSGGRRAGLRRQDPLVRMRTTYGDRNTPTTALPSVK